jgi:hypothetical protein
MRGKGVLVGVAALAAAVSIGTFNGCGTAEGDKVTVQVGGPGIGGSVVWERFPGVFRTLPEGWTFCRRLTVEGLNVCVFCPQAGAPPVPGIPAGCKLVDVNCDGGPFEVWCGDVTTVPDVASLRTADLVGEYTVTLLRFHSPVGPTLGDNGRVTMHLRVEQTETLPQTRLRGDVAITAPSGASIAYAPGVSIPSGSIISLPGLASDLAYNLYALGFDTLSFTDNAGLWEFTTMRHETRRAGVPEMDLPYVFLTLNGQRFDQPYDVRSN